MDVNEILTRVGYVRNNAKPLGKRIEFKNGNEPTVRSANRKRSYRSHCKKVTSNFRNM